MVLINLFINLKFMKFQKMKKLMWSRCQRAMRRATTS